MKFSEIPFNPKFEAETVEKAKAWLRNSKPNHTYTANFAVFSDTESQPYTHQPCHGAISRCSLEERSIVATECGWQRSGKERELIIPFLTWFLSDDCYMSRFILNRDNLDECADVGFIVSADVSTPLMQNVLITTRHFYEVAEKAFDKFNELVVTKGCDPKLAYLFCILTWFSTKGGGPLNSKVASFSGHRATPIPHTLEGFKRFMAGEINPTKVEDYTDWAEYYRHRLDFHGGISAFDTVDAYSIPKFTFLRPLLEVDEDFRRALRVSRGDTNPDLYTPPNPFKALANKDNELKPGDVTYTEAFEFVVPYLSEKKPWLTK